MLAVLGLDGTLVDRDAGFRTWLAGFAAEHGLDDAGRAWLRAWDQEAKERGAFFAGLVDHFGLAMDPDAPVEAVPRGDAAHHAGLRGGAARAGRATAARVAEQTGFRKPDPRAFEQAVGEPADARVVGDDPALDADAASWAGLFSVWISHGRRWPEALRPPAVTVETPADALSFLLHNPPAPAPKYAGSR